jgi:alcohol dehydrogenase class IV
MRHAPHGAVCAALLPHVMTANLRALRATEDGGGALARMGEVGRILTGRADAGADDAVAWVVDTLRRLEVQPLSALGVTSTDLPAIAEQAQRSSSMKGNPVALMPEDLVAILTAAL